MKETCGWGINDPLMTQYHDSEWGVAVHDDKKHFEFIVLEGVQAGLSWSTVLHRRESYRRAFNGFEPRKVAIYTNLDVERIINEPGIIRNRQKIESAINNAKHFVEIQREFGTFDEYVWGYVNGNPKVNRFTSFSEIPSETEESRSLSRDLKRRGFSFVGPTICYAYMQAAGLVNDHLIKCFRWKEVQQNVEF